MRKGVGISFFTLVCAGVIFAAEPPPSAVPRPVVVVRTEVICPADDAAPLAGVRAFLDPETGQLRPGTAEENAALESSLGIGGMRALSAAPLVLKEYSNGMLSMELGDEFMNDLVVTRGADGSLVYGHGFAPAPPPLEEK